MATSLFFAFSFSFLPIPLQPLAVGVSVPALLSIREAHASAVAIEKEVLEAEEAAENLNN